MESFMPAAPLPRAGRIMAGIVFAEIGRYIDSLANRGTEVQQRIEKQGEGWPIVGAAEGSFLHILVRAAGARRILELGTAIGYSGTWLARALPDKGELVTVEHDPGTADLARKNFEAAGVASRVRIEVGDAVDVLEDLRGPFDLVFNDIEKVHYLAVLPYCLRLLRPGGLLVTDNVLWGGEVARGARSRETKTIREYNETLARDPRVIVVIVPLRDGVSVALKVRD